MGSEKIETINITENEIIFSNYHFWVEADQFSFGAIRIKPKNQLGKNTILNMRALLVTGNEAISRRQGVCPWCGK